MPRTLTTVAAFAIGAVAVVGARLSSTGTLDAGDVIAPTGAVADSARVPR